MHTFNHYRVRERAQRAKALCIPPLRDNTVVMSVMEIYELNRLIRAEKAKRSSIHREGDDPVWWWGVIGGRLRGGGHVCGI